MSFLNVLIICSKQALKVFVYHKPVFVWQNLNFAYLRLYRPKKEVHCCLSRKEEVHWWKAIIEKLPEYVKASRGSTVHAILVQTYLNRSVYNCGNQQMLNGNSKILFTIFTYFSFNFLMFFLIEWSFQKQISFIF